MKPGNLSLRKLTNGTELCATLTIIPTLWGICPAEFKRPVPFTKGRLANGLRDVSDHLFYKLRDLADSQFAEWDIYLTTCSQSEGFGRKSVYGVRYTTGNLLRGWGIWLLILLVYPVRNVSDNLFTWWENPTTCVQGGRFGRWSVSGVRLWETYLTTCLQGLRVLTDTVCSRAEGSIWQPVCRVRVVSRDRRQTLSVHGLTLTLTRESVYGS